MSALTRFTGKMLLCYFLSFTPSVPAAFAGPATLSRNCNVQPVSDLVTEAIVQSAGEHELKPSAQIFEVVRKQIHALRDCDPDSNAAAVYGHVFDYLLSTPDEGALDILKSYVPDMLRSEDDKEARFQSFTDLLLSYGRFDDAREFKSRYGQFATINDLPEFIDTGESVDPDARRIVIPLEDKGQFSISGLEFEDYTGIVVIGHPQCNFSSAFFAELDADPELRQQIVQQSVFLRSAWKVYSDQSVLNWNREHPEYAFNIVVQESDWPELNYWGTPTFYFFRNGMLVRKVVGWRESTREAQKAKLWMGLREISQIE